MKGYKSLENEILAKGINSCKRRSNPTKVKLDLYYVEINSYTKFQVNTTTDGRESPENYIFAKGNNSIKSRSNATKVKLELYYVKTNSYKCLERWAKKSPEMIFFKHTNALTVLITSCMSCSSPISLRCWGELELSVPVECCCRTESESSNLSAIRRIVSGSLRNTSKSVWTSKNWKKILSCQILFILNIKNFNSFSYIKLKNTEMAIFAQQ